MKPLFLLSLLLYSPINAQWERVPEIPATRNVYSLLAVHDTLFAGTDSLLYVGADSGTTWFTGVPPAASPDFVSTLLKTQNVLLAGTFQSGVFKSTNDGLSWQPFSAGLSGLGAMSVSNLLVRRDSLIAGTLGASVFITKSDFSHSWASWGDSLADYEGDNVFKMQTVGTTVLAGAGANGYMFRYTDSQPWWNPIQINTPRRVGQTVSGIASGATAVVAGSTDGIYRSTDEGLSWVLTNAAIPPSTVAVLVVYHDSTFFAVTTTPSSFSFSSLQISTDQGQTWESRGSFNMPVVLDIAIVGESFFLGRTDGLWKAGLSQLLTTVDESATAPLAFTLHQNYPNPFNPETRISYSISRESDVSIVIYDLLGRQLSTLVNAHKQPGNYSVSWNAADLPSGIYFYKLDAGGVLFTKKMVLMR